MAESALFRQRSIQIRRDLRTNSHRKAGLLWSLPGSLRRRIEHLDANLAALDVQLSEQQIAVSTDASPQAIKPGSLDAGDELTAAAQAGITQAE
jgi:hypothetical protein